MGRPIVRTCGGAAEMGKGALDSWGLWTYKDLFNSKGEVKLSSILLCKHV